MTSSLHTVKVWKGKTSISLGTLLCVYLGESSEVLPLLLVAVSYDISSVLK